MDYTKLQNGSDIRGTALPGVESEPVTLTAAACRDIGRGFALWLRARFPSKTVLRVAIGRDSRLSGEELAAGLASAMAEQGLQVTDLGLCSTPAMFMSTITPGYEFDGAVMITASHLPWNRNGFKFFTAAGGAESTDIREILSLAGSTETTGLPAGTITGGDFMDAYAAILRRKVIDAAGTERPLAGRHIVVDAGNGAGGFYAEKVLVPLGADITGSRYLEPDGHFPNHVPNPELPEAMRSIRDAVLESHADFGIIFDTDVDRAGAVLASGEELNRNRLIAILSAILLREHPGTAIVTDSVTSTGLASFISGLGGMHHRFKRGYRNVINESVRLNNAGQDSQLAIETSGHAAMKENYFLDDGAYLVTKLLVELACGRDLENLIAGLREPAESREFRLKLPAEDFRSAGQAVLDRLGAYAALQPGWTVVQPNYEGIRVELDSSHGNGWFLLRLSLHDPILPLNIESDSEGGVRVIAQELYRFLTSQTAPDLSPLKSYLNL